MASASKGEGSRAARPRLRGFDPVKLADEIEKRVVKGELRKYYRFRGSRFYGGSAVGDVVGCNLRCAFCWTGRPRDDLRLGFFVSPEESYRRLTEIASSRRYRYVRLSGGEPTIGFQHLRKLLELIEQDGRFTFILETNGVLLGARPGYVKALAGLRRLHVRVSIKACSPDLFALITGARPEFFEYPIRAIRYLADYGVSFHVALFAAFGSEECWARLLERLAEEAGPEALEGAEVEPLVLYQPARRRLRLLGLKPRFSYEPG